MGLAARAVAENASFHAFINGYFREIDCGAWSLNTCCPALVDFPYDLKGVEVVELVLPVAELRVLMDVAYRSKVGRHHFHGVFTQRISSVGDTGDWQQADLMYLLIALIREIYQRQRITSIDADAVQSDAVKVNEMELLGRLMGSYQSMTHFLAERNGDKRLSSFDFIDTEQSILFGHWLHPTPKSQQGIAFWQQAFYSPELCGQFKLHYFSASRSLIRQGSSLERATSDILFDEVARYENIELPDGHVLVPVHPLQAHSLLLERWVRELLADGSLIYLGEKGADYTATSSVRTVFNEDSEWMIKLSIPVKITNSLRTNKRRELEDGMVVESYLQSTGFLDSRPQFKVVDDPAYITINHPDNHDLDSGFEVVLRRNSFKGDAGNGVCSILTLVQEPIPANDNIIGISLLKKIIMDLVIKEGRTKEAVTLEWFDRYWSCALESLITLYDRYGIALEAHQQNSLLDVSEGYPSCYYYRDNQGFYLSSHFSEELADVGKKLNLTNIFYDDEKIFTAISYYVFVNQLFAVIYRLGADGLIPEDVLVERCREHLKELKNNMKGVGKEFIDYILNSARLDFKTNLLARVNNIDELQEGMEHAVYSTIVNPLFEESALQNNLTKDSEGEYGAVYM